MRLSIRKFEVAMETFEAILYLSNTHIIKKVNRKKKVKDKSNMQIINHINKLFSYYIQKYEGSLFFMDYELLMNGTVKIGMQAPDFEAVTTMGIINSNDYRGKWVVLFSHPGDFTPVCTTEIIAMANANTYFENIGASLIGLSVDSNSSHLAWLYDIYIRTGIIVPFPIISDRNGNIARKYGMISNDISNTETVRNVYIINPEGIVKSILVYPMEVGRFIPEILRLIKALQVTECCNAVAGANWMPGNPLIMRPPKTFQDLQAANQSLLKSGDGLGWYLRFQAQNECQMNNQLENQENFGLNNTSN